MLKFSRAMRYEYVHINSRKRVLIIEKTVKYKSINLLCQYILKDVQNYQVWPYACSFTNFPCRACMYCCTSST